MIEEKDFTQLGTRTEIVDNALESPEAEPYYDDTKVRSKEIRKPSLRLMKASLKRNNNSTEEEKTKFGVEEKKEIIRLFKKNGNKWKVISDELSSTTDNTVKNIFFGIIRMALRKMSRFFGINCQSGFISTIKPKILTDIMNLKFTYKSAGKTIKMIDVVEQFAFTDFLDILDQIPQISLITSKRVLVYLFRFIIGFYKETNKQIEFFLEFSLKESLQKNIDRYLKVRQRFIAQKEQNMKMKKARTVLKKYKSFIKKIKKNEQIKTKLNRFAFCYVLTEVLSQAELVRNPFRKGRRRLDKGDFIKVLSFVDQQINEDEQIPSENSVQAITGNCLDCLAGNSSLDNLTYININ